MQLGKLLTTFSLIFLLNLSLSYKSAATGGPKYYDLEVESFETFGLKTVTYGDDKEFEGVRTQLNMVHKTGELKGRTKKPTHLKVAISSLENALYTIIFTVCAERVFNDGELIEKVENWDLIRDSFHDTLFQLYNQRIARQRARIKRALKKIYDDFKVYNFDDPENMMVAVRNPEDGVALRVMTMKEIAPANLLLIHCTGLLKYCKELEQTIRYLDDPTFVPNYSFLLGWTEIFKPKLKESNILIMSKAQGKRASVRLCTLKSSANPFGKLIDAFYQKTKYGKVKSTDTRFVFSPQKLVESIPTIPTSKEHDPFTVPSLLNLVLAAVHNSSQSSHPGAVEAKEEVVRLQKANAFYKEFPRISFDTRITTEALTDGYVPIRLIYDRTH